MADKTQNNRFDADFQNMEAKADVIPQDEEKNKAKAEIMALRQKVAAGEITEEVRTEIIALKSRLNVPVNKEEVKEIVSEAISKDRIYVSFLLIDTLIKYLPEQDRPALKAYVGSMIVETFEKSGRVLTMKSDHTISISSLSNLGPDEEKKNVEISNMVNSLIKE